MAQGELQLNGVGYALKSFDDGALVRRYQIDEFGEVFRTQGLQRQADLVTRSTRVFGPFTGGIGRNRIPISEIDDPAAYMRCWDSTCDTRFPGDTRLAILAESTTAVTYGKVIRAATHWNNKLYSVWDRYESSSLKGVIIADYDGSATTWANGDVVINTGTAEAVPSDILAHKDYLIVLGATGTNHFVRRASDATTWNAPAVGITAGLLTTTVPGYPYYVSYGRLAEIGGEAVAAVWHEDDHSVTFFSSADAGDNWADEGIDLAGDEVVGLAVYPGTDGADKLWVLTKGGLWEVDTSPTTWTYRKHFDLPIRGSYTGQHLVVHQGLLWVAHPAYNTSAVSISTVDTSGGGYVFASNMGLDRDDGINLARAGAVTDMVSSGAFLFIAVGGHGTGSATVLCWNGQGWHHMADTGDSGSGKMIETLAVSTRDDGATRLHFNIRTSSNVSTCRFLGEALANPASGIEIKREESGIVDLPETDGGMSTTPAAWLQVRIAAATASLSPGTEGSGDSSDNYIDVSHGLDGAVRTTTDLGDILRGQKALLYGSGAGESGVSDALRLTLQRTSSETATPELRSVEMVYLKKGDSLTGFEFQVDLEATAQLRSDASVEAIVTTLEAARDLVTLPTLQYANMTQAYVKVREVDWREVVESVGGGTPGVVPDASAVRRGIVLVRCEEVL